MKRTKPSHPEDFADQNAISEKIENTTWISAQAARKIVSQGEHENGEAVDAIVRRAKHGQISALAQEWVVIEDGQRHEGSGHLIERGFWDDTDMQQNWLLGDFKSIKFHDGTRFEVEALSVSFDEAAIRSMSAARGADTADQIKSKEKAKPINPGKYDWAKAVGTIVFEWAEDGSWEPSSQSEVSQRLSGWFSQQEPDKDGCVAIPDEKLLKQYARWLYREFRKRQGE